MNLANTRKILKPTTNSFTLLLLLAMLLTWRANCFTFSSVAISMDSNQVGTSTTYYIYLDRQYDDSLSTTAWASNPVASNATIIVTFPVEYSNNAISSATCIDVSVNDASITGYSCAISGNSLVVSNALTSVSSVYNTYITIGSVTNPGSTITTSIFTAKIGNDNSGSSSSAKVTFTAGQLAALTINFVGGVVNQTNDMIVTFTTGHSIPQNGAIQVTFPNSLTWTRDLSASHTIPINGTLACYGISSNINNSTINCQGLFATQTVTLTSPFSQIIAANQNVSFAIKGLFAPPTTQQIDKLKVTTCDQSLNPIDIQSGFISGLVPQTLQNFTITPTVSPFAVNNFLGGLIFSFALPDTISNNDYFIISFPSGTTITYMTRTGSISIQSATYNSTNTSLILFQSSTNPNYPTGTVITLTFIRYKAPPSIRPTSPISLTIFSYCCSKMSASASVTAIYNNYTLTASAAPPTVNTFTSYSFSFTMNDALTSTGYISLILDPNLCKTASQIATLTSNLSISINGTSIRSSPSTQVVAVTVNGSPTYSLVFTNLNTSTSNIPSQSMTIKVNNLLNHPSVLSMTYFSLSTYYTSSSIDLVATANYSGSITLQTGSISLVSISSSATSTYSFGTLTLQISNSNPIPANGYLMIIFPSDLNVLSVYQTSINVTSSQISAVATNFISNNTIILKVASQIPSNSSVRIAILNAVTQNSTRTTATFIIRTYDQSFNAIDVSTNSMGLAVQSGNSFNSISLARSNTTNSAQANYAISFEQIQNSSNVTNVGILFSSTLLLNALGTVYEQFYNQTSNSYYQVALLVSKINDTYIRVSLSKTTTLHNLIFQLVTNPPSMQPLTSPIIVYTLTADSQYIYSQMQTQDIINDSPSTIIVTNYSFSNYAYGQNSSLTLSLAQPTDWPALVYSLQLDMPSSFDFSGVSCSGFTGMTCSLFAPTRKLTITASNSSNLPSTMSIVINNLSNPPIGSNSQVFSISSFDSLNYLIQSDSSTVVFQNLCNSPCRTCNTSNTSSCLTCYNSSQSNFTLLYQNQCLSSCPLGSYQVNSSLCSKCSSQCATCSYLSTNCTSCTLNSTLPYLYNNKSLSPIQGTCLSSCYSGTYLLNNTCYDCNGSCSQCQNATYCTSCKASYYLYKGTCITSCTNTTVTINNTCQDCSSNCYTCLGTIDYCTSCPSFTFLSNGSCLSSCPSTNMFVNSAQTCQLCSGPCARCSISASNCTSCNLTSNNSHLFNSSCIATCPELYYSNSTTLICQSCASLNINCSNCSSPTTCFTCDSGYLFFLLNSTCTKTVPSGYVAINGTIYACNSLCLTCQGTQTNCTSCSSPLNLYNNSCVSTCPASITVTISNVCRSCSYPCSTCIDLITKCISCSANSSLYYDSIQYNCVNATSCPTGTFANTTTMTCQNCSSDCLVCSGSSNNCSSCATGYFYYSANNSCLNTCPSGTVGINSTCTSCSQPCQTCTNTTTNCTSCRVSSPSLYLDRILSSCVLDSNCPNNTYPNTSTMTCQLCTSPCAQCTSSVICTACVPSYSLYYTNGSCLTTCPDGYISLIDGDNLICQACMSPCGTCDGALNNCTSCIASSSLYLQFNTCVNATQCSNLSYPNSTTNKCTACQSPCLSCSSSTTCTTCQNGTYFYNSTCYNSTSCPTGTVAGQNSTTGLDSCLSCTYPCSSCSLNTTNCTSCNTSTTTLFLDGNSCGNSSSCSNLTYANSSTYKCQLCISPCLTCINSTVCKTCISGYFLSVNSSCVSMCSSGQYAVNVSGTLTCKTCSVVCGECYQSATNCSSCQNGTYLFNGSCVNQTGCPAGRYANTSTNTCETCLGPCSSCLNTSFCQSCTTNYLIASTGQCVNSSSCPNNTVAYNSSGQLQCTICNTDCQGCQLTPSNCTSCSNSSTFLLSGSCVNSSGCITGTYPNSTLGTCSSCKTPCSQCSNNSFCISCVSPLYIISASGTCVNSTACPLGTTGMVSNGSNICMNCSSSCQNCVGLPSNCTSCPQNSSTFLQNNSCVTATQCRNGAYADNITLICTICPSTCSLCSSNSSCSNCSSNYYLYGTSCIPTCPYGTVGDNTTSSCLNCTSNCSTCSGSVDNCTSCSQSNSTLYLLNNTCVDSSSCMNGTYPNSTTFTCSVCNSNCTTCTSYIVCTSCVNGFYLFQTGTCVDICPNGWVGVVISGGGVCQKCASPCLTCLGSVSTCRSCQQSLTSSLFFNNNSCVSADLCPNGTYANTTTFICTPCSIQCQTCTNSPNNCSACSSGYFLLNNSCLSSCPNTTIADTSSQSCKPCTNSCATCLNQTNVCTSCTFNTFLQDNSCAQTCPNGTAAIVSTLRCQTCQNGCVACLNSTSNCSSCASGYYFYNYTCSDTCPSGYYGDSNTNKCANCISNCSTCTNQTFCLSCSSPYMLSSNQCLSTCPPTLPYNSSNICANCSTAIPGCLSCNSSTLSASCETCSTGMLIYKSYCYKSCPSGSQPDGNGSCKQTQSSLDSGLTGSLTSGAIFPLPFTITGSIIFVACFMSKLQNKNTYIIGVAYALYGFIQTACLFYVILSFSPDNNQPDFKKYLLAALFVIGGINIFGLVVQSWQLAGDQKFAKWLKIKCNFVFYGITVLISALGNYKFKLIIFTKLFNFQCVRAQLEHVQKFRVFNVMSFLGVGHQGLVLYVSALILVGLSPNTPQFLIFLDLIAVNLLNIILALAASSKGQDFFEQQQDDGMKINKVFNIYDEYQLNPIDDTLNEVKQRKGLDSRQIMMDQDDQFTLSISDREDSSSIIKGQPHSADNFAVMKHNKSVIQAYHSKNKQKEDKGGIGLNHNFSAVYDGDLSKAKRKKFQEEHQISDVILQRTEKQSNQKLSEHPQIEKQTNEIANNGPVQNIFDDQGEQEVQLPQQVDIIPIMNEEKGEQAGGVESKPLDQPNLQSQLQTNQHNQEQNIIVQNMVASKLFQQINKPLPARQIKVYKGKGGLNNQLPQDIQQIDLTISKKQKQLIQLRKSIRKRQRSQQKRSLRKSQSRQKTGRGAQSQKGADFVSNNFMQKVSSQEFINLKQETKRIPLNINVLSNQSGIIEEELQAAPGTIKMPSKRQRPNQNQNNDEIEDNINQKDIMRTPVVKKPKIQESIHQFKNQFQSKQIQINSNRVEGNQRIQERIQQKTQKKKIRYEIQDMNQMYFQSKEIPQSDDLVQDFFDYKEQPTEEPLPLQKNIFEDPKDQSFFEEEEEEEEVEQLQVEHKKFQNNFLGMKAPPSKQKKVIDNRDDKQAQNLTDMRININIQADQQNTPLQLKKNNQKGGWQGQALGEDALDQQVHTQRVKVAPNRSHLLKQQSIKINSSDYQQLQQTSTVRQVSQKQFTSRVTAFQRPPLQYRPSTSVKNRMHATGFRNTQKTSRGDSLSKQTSNWELPNKTMKQGQFKEFRSKQVSRQGGDNLQIYPSSFSSNHMRLDSQDMNEQPRKPTILQGAKTNARQNTFKKSTQGIQSSFDNRSARKSMKSYRSRSIDRQQAQKQHSKAGEFENDDLKEYYNRKDRSKSKSRSKSRQGNRSSDKRMRELEKIYLQRLQYKQ